ncbi:hypothetical protein [Robertkochia aurantiaca]|uniref:hypothetical protein n=1 Tax=Robertkochia aurantiaca TaxID=2873700 RepID=UPI001CD03133|nr:hypothetical protein [Robertkochia sp. 3YJGBD-33]
MIAIHFDNKDDFSTSWVAYCEKNGVPFKLVNCYENDIFEQLDGCDCLLWHIENFDYREQIFAKFLIKSLEEKQIKTFPNYDTVWHYDDKVAQKYLLESVNAPLAKSYVFYSEKEARSWAKQTSYPKVFKLRKGSGSKNVLLAKSFKQADKLISKAFSKGFPTLDMKVILKERIRKYKNKKESLLGVMKGIVRLFIGVPFRNMSPNEMGYAYFQDFLPGNDHDQRIIVIGNRAIGLKRMVRDNDFRASGSGNFFYDRELFDEEFVKIAFELNRKLNFQSMAYDFVYDQKGKPKIVEISYCFNKVVYYDCPGYWDEQLNWHETKVIPEEWMVEDLIKNLNAHVSS